MKRRLWYLVAVAGFIFTLAGAQPARADHGDDRRECWRKIEKEEYKLEKEIRKHGWHSRQARKQREKLYRVRRECGGWGWGRHRDWRDDDDWRRDRDWRDHDGHGCRDGRHRHDHDGFIWRDGRWLRRR